MRTVIDTNVFISSFFGGNHRKVIDLWMNGSITLCLSRAILDEYVEIFERFGLEDEGEIKELLESLRRKNSSQSGVRERLRFSPVSRNGFRKRRSGVRMKAKLLHPGW